MRKLLIFPLAVLVASCAADGGRGESHDLTLDGDRIIVAEGAPVLEKLKTLKVENTPYRAEFTAAGMVQAIPTDYAEIASPFAGRIVRSFVRLGQKVVPGSPIFEISSPSFFETSKTFYQARQEMELALKNLNREQDLLKNRVGAAKDVEEAEVNYELKKKDYENALAALSVYQIDPDRMALGQPLVVRSPIAGEIVRNRIVLGQYIKEDAGALAVVADLRKVWVAAHVKEKDIPLIRGLREVDVSLTALPEDTIRGRIYHISELLDEDTRSVEVLVECDNADRRMKPNMYGTVRLADAATQAMLIPASAVLQQEESSYVLVREEASVFRKAPVEVKGTDDGRCVVLSGLRPGDEIVSEGAIYLLDAR